MDEQHRAHSGAYEPSCAAGHEAIETRLRTEIQREINTLRCECEIALLSAQNRALMWTALAVQVVEFFVIWIVALIR